MTGPVVITGAAGFIGRHTVKAAREAGLSVRAVVRRAATAPEGWAAEDGIEVFEADLTKQPDLTAVFAGAEAVIHAAARMTGRAQEQCGDTLAVSEAVLGAVLAAQVKRVVLVGSITVHDVTALADFDRLSEATPLECDPARRDGYAAAKLAQEELFQATAQMGEFSLSVLRPGAVYGPGRLGNAHLGPGLGSLLLLLDGGGEIPLCQVTLCAEALVRAAQAPEGVGEINLIDDDLPDRRRFVAALRASGWPRRVLRLPLGPVRLAAWITPNGGFMPGLLRRKVLEARHKPLRYDNARMHNRLGPVTMPPFEEAMARAIAAERDETK
ncbi:Nucleoside-diphosphate-sugar epimerase [Salinihabitans flavidus]|uniref:Nucleoside-diphosphate-sugar epimerase n=1 Tax=Salinihabitans flavidus TaxID=569882 RepID=A0A1H8P081_9RHOB|nr:NAD(P)-dependent oxidoreductase [Salinihabitans flavidus]SEO35023.1 Nucleoside-diphosphate-sugar epimerase [Salinihabitans flavidus]